MSHFTSRQVAMLCVLSMSIGAVFTPPIQSLAQPSEPGGAQQGPLAETPQPLATPPALSDSPSSRASTRAVGTITGQGTVGNISKFTGTNAIGNSVLFEKGGKVGIGTTSPVGSFTAYSSTGIGVYGSHSGSAGDQPGVQGETLSTVANAVGVRGTVTTTAPGAMSTGVRGINSGTNANGFGVFGTHAGGGSGVYGSSVTGNGVLGDSSGGVGVRGRHLPATGITPGVSGETYSNDANAIGVRGLVNSTSPGAASAAVRGINNGTNSGGYGVYGSHAGGGAGIYGISSNGAGIYGTSSSGDGVFGSSSSSYAVHGSSSTGIGVYGISYANTGVYGFSSNDTGVYGASTNGYAGYFQGSVLITGNLAKGSGSFKIDHPLHPATEYLSHSFVESPDMMNVYNGNTTTNGKGEAWVTLPSYFQSLNRDFRYQLTPMGQFAQAIVGHEIVGNRFQIKTDKPGVKVSWQVTGIRNDAYAREHRIRIEETKTGADRGKYLYPAGFGAGPDKQIGAPAPRLAKRG